MKEIPVIRITDLAGILLESVHLTECVRKLRECYVRAVPGIRTERPRLIARLRSLREKLIKIGAKVVRHARYVVFQMAEVVVPKALFCEILERIGRLNRQGFGSDPNNSGRIMCCSA